MDFVAIWCNQLRPPLPDLREERHRELPFPDWNRHPLLKRISIHHRYSVNAGTVSQ